MDSFLNTVARTVRAAMKWPALLLHKITRGRIKPNHVTLISVLGHVGVLWALWSYRPILAGLLLIIFGLMDSLDGALARLQGTTSLNGMFFDATSDRLKEVMIYAGIALFFMAGTSGYELGEIVWLPVAALA
jgi:CDP-diacylglycerol--glycerol-3-phosphate 3-phosphatidyltransferase